MIKKTDAVDVADPWLSDDIRGRAPDGPCKGNVFIHGRTRERRHSKW